MPDPFIECIQQAFKDTHVAARTADLVEQYKRYLAFNERAGVPDPGALAMQQTIEVFTREKFMKMNQLHQRMQFIARGKDAFIPERVAKIKTVGAGMDPGKGVGAKIGVVRRSFLESDPRTGVVGVVGAQTAYHGKYMGMFGDHVRYFMKNVLGVRAELADAEVKNIAYEIFGRDTGSRAAKAIAEAYKSIQSISLKDLKRYGAAVHELVTFHLPQWQSAIRLIKATKEVWVADHMIWVDWNQTVWPDGRVIAADQRARVLGEAYDTIVYHGNNRGEPSFSGPQGRAMGNMLEQDRFLHYKGPDEWLAMNDKYMDGNTLDTIVRHIERRSRQVGTMSVLGPNPASAVDVLNQIAKRAAADAAKSGTTALDKQAVDQLERSYSRFKIMADMVLHKNPEDQNAISSFVSTTTNLATAALLKSAVFISVATDLMTTMAYRFSQNQSVLGFMGTYMRTMFPGGAKANAVLSAQAGFVAREAVSNNFIAMRYGMGTTLGRPVSQHISETALRLTMLQRHTIALRAANQQETMAMLWRERGLPLDRTVAARAMLRQAGVTEREWDIVRNNMVAWEPEPGAKFFRPLDILNMAHADKHRLFEKFHAMVVDQSQAMVPLTTLEARAVLSRGVRSDSLMGAVFHSAGMYHGYPVTMALMAGRMLAGGPEVGLTRSKFAASMLLGGVFAGAVGVTLRDLAVGREPQPLDDPKFWTRAFLSSMGVPVIGDLLTAGMTADPAGSVKGSVAGPLGSMAGDLAAIATSPLGWAGLSDNERPIPATMRKAVDFVERYLTPATFYSYLPIERAVFDTMRDFVDPVGSRAANQAMEEYQQKHYGRGYWSKRGGGLESLLP